MAGSSDRAEHDLILREALELARREHPNADPRLHYVYANSVASLVTGQAGGYGGPSVREHVVERLHPSGSMTYEDATRLLLDPQGLIFGPLTDVHYRVAEEVSSHHDPAADAEALQPHLGRDTVIERGWAWEE